jgi:hypothetical protein
MRNSKEKDKEYKRKYYLKTRKQQRKQQRSYYLNNLQRIKKLHKAWYLKNKLALGVIWKRKNAAKNVKLSVEEVTQLFDKFDGLCWICMLQPAMDVDHCHTCDKVRGVLCRPCNQILAGYEKAKKEERKFIGYLKRCGIVCVKSKVYKRGRIKSKAPN